jgi:hypothetical protein
MSAELDSYMLPNVERIKALAGNRIASVTPHDDCYEITFRSNPTDDYGFEAWIYRDERQLEIGARRQGEPGSLWYRPFERAEFSNEDDQWTAFARLLSDLFEKSSRIEIRAGWLFLQAGCFLEGDDRPVWVVASLYLIKEARQLARMSPKTWHSGPIPSTEEDSQ